MDDLSKILVCRTAWMESYASASEPSSSHHGWVQDGNLPGECLNFLLQEDGRYHGYVQVKGDSDGKPGRINLQRLGAKASDDAIEGINVLWVAPSSEGGICLVGAYLNATVFRTPRFDQLSSEIFPANNGKRDYRIAAEAAVLLPLDYRKIRFPRGKNGIGRSDLWYGINDEPHEPLRLEALQLVREIYNETSMAGSSAGVDSSTFEGDVELSEGYRLARHLKFERRTQVRRFLVGREKCEACGFDLEGKDPDLWRSSLEVHHLKPYKYLNKDSERTVKAKDVAILCANCHRAIHRLGERVSVAKFRQHLKLR